MIAAIVVAPINYPELTEAQTAFAAFVRRIPSNSNIGILCDGDVDGLGAGVVLWNYLERNGFDTARLISLHTPKGGNAFTPPMTAIAAAQNLAALFVLDLGIRDYQIVPGLPTLLIDHHRPEGEPPDSTVLTGYQWQPIPTSSLLTYLLCNHAGQVEDKAWVAAIGNLGDLGPEHPELVAAAKAQKQKYIREATSLLNAAKRCSDPDTAIPAAFRALLQADTARAIVEENSPDLELLRSFKAEVTAALNEAKRVAPRFSKTEPVALLRFDSPARVHPLLAQSWRGRLPKYIVIAANGGYMPDKVSFSTRTNLDVNLLDFLSEHGQALEGHEAEYGHGHNKATGGTLSTANFARLLQNMGFQE